MDKDIDQMFSKHNACVQSVPTRAFMFSAPNLDLSPLLLHLSSSQLRPDGCVLLTLPGSHSIRNLAISEKWHLPLDGNDASPYRSESTMQKWVAWDCGGISQSHEC